MKSVVQNVLLWSVFHFYRCEQRNGAGIFGLLTNAQSLCPDYSILQIFGIGDGTEVFGTPLHKY